MMMLRRFLLWLLALLVMLLLASAWYARVVWEEWRQSNNLRSLDWQGLEVSQAGLGLAGFSASRMRDGQLYRVNAETLSLGWSWHWHGPLPDTFRVERLRLEAPAWPDSGGQQASATEVSLPMPRSWPAWLPDAIAIDRLELALPDGIRAEGDLAISRLSEPDDRQMITEGMTIEMPIAGRKLAGWQLHDGRASLVIAGQADEQSATLEFRDRSRLELVGVDAPDNAARLDSPEIDLAGSTLSATYTLRPLMLETLSFEGPVLATTASIRQPQLQPQSWTFDGRLAGNLEASRLDGRLVSDAGAKADVTLRIPAAGAPELDAELSATGAQAIHALEHTFAAWPEELEVSAGSIRASLALGFPAAGIRARGQADFAGLEGVFARTAWTGLDGRVTVDLSADRLQARTSGLTVATVNPGMVFSDIRIAGTYASTLERPAAGSLALEQASAQFLGGSVRIDPGEWQLSHRPLRFPLELNGLDLSELMRVYPAEGLSGTGVLNGTVPVMITGQGISIASGQIEAQAPGGTLELPADRLSDLAQDNEAMALVVRAMQNFNYSVLNSAVDYDRNGKLTLGLRIEGSSPDVRDGHPIVLNINLEEDIPALLTSLQLSGRVNEAVTEKVRELIRKRDAQGRLNEPRQE